METNIRVLGANRSRLFRELVVSALSKHAGIKIVGEAENDNDIPALLALLKVMRDSALRMKEEQSHERDFIPGNG